MARFNEKIKEKLRQGVELERSFDPRIEKISRRLWPWHENKLLFFVISLVVLDFCSTFAFLELSGNKNLYESGPVARWALEMGGFSRLFLIDLIAACVLMLFAFIVRKAYTSKGFKGYGRIAFILVLVPYIVITIAAVFNNVALTFVQ
jgi:hypothetical protein